MTSTLLHYGIPVALALAVFWSAFVVDFAHARYAQRRDAGRRVAAACWGTFQWVGALGGFAAAVYVSPWYLPFEGVGVFVGILVGTPGRAREAEGPRLRLVRP